MDQRQLDFEYARQLTAALRRSRQSGWSAIRDRLRLEGVSPDDAAVGTLFRDDVILEFGIITARDGRSFSFDCEVSGEAPPSGDYLGEAYLRTWKQLDGQQLQTYAGDINVAKQVLDVEGSS
ncbi:MAG: hypothetical protein ABR505_04110 [Actinomycetota bacterium]